MKFALEKLEQTATQLLVLVTLWALAMTVNVAAHGGEDHSTPAPATVKAGQPAASVVTAERNVQTDAGRFNVKLQRSPADPRTGETVQVVARFAERIEGGFGGADAVPLEKAAVAARIITADGKTVSEKVAVTAENDGDYRLSYAFAAAGEYKLALTVTTGDNRQFTADFPVSVANAPINWGFLLGLAAWALVIGGLLVGLYLNWWREETNLRRRLLKAAPVAAGVLAVFGLGALAWAYFAPPREKRAISPPTGQETETATNLGEAALTGGGARLIVPKESQLLFGIRTEPVSAREITGGLKVTGAVQARPDAQAVVAPPVAGRILLKAGLTVGAAVGRGETLGTVEQVLDATAQASLEGQRLGVEAQRLNVEAQRLNLRNAALEQKARQTEQQALANQARTRLAQAQRELKRAQNLYEVGAVPQKRVEEANTAVAVTQQEVAAAEQQAKLSGEQIRATQTAQTQFRDFQPVNAKRSFPLIAPVTGLISEVKATSGQQVEAGAPILSIVNLTTVYLSANVFEKDLPVVRDAARATYTAAGIPGEVYRIGTDTDGRLVSIGQTVNPATRAVPVLYEVKNPLNRLRDGMFVEITIDRTGARKVLSVPKNAVVTEQGQTFVFVFLGGETFAKRAVVLGAEGQDFYEVKSGVKDSERVVVEGVYQLRTTQPS